MSNFLQWIRDQLKTLPGQIVAFVLGLFLILAVIGAWGAVSVAQEDSADGENSEPTIIITP